MGYDGYLAYVCKNGHHQCVDAFEYSEDTKCDECGSKSARVGSVDCTNGSPYFLDFEFHQLTPDILSHCPVCNKVSERIEGTYEFKRVEMYESEKDDYIKTTMDAVHNKSSEPCSEFCTLHQRMKSKLMDLWNECVINCDSNSEVDKTYKSMLEIHFPFIGDLFQEEVEEKPTVDLDKCCEGTWELREVKITGYEPMKFPHCMQCGKLLYVSKKE